MSDELNERGDRLIADLRGRALWNSGDVPRVETGLFEAARDYRNSLMWRIIPVRLADSVELPPVVGEFEAR